MTLGTRIAQQRKKLGLSQEALGQRMGVSRQAISKWEADAAVPEIDKLIVLSRLFEVSVGWLLGIDESPAEKSGGFTDEQLYMVEEIVKRYQQPRQGSEGRKKTLFRCGVVLALCASVLALCLSGAAVWKLVGPEGSASRYEQDKLKEGYLQLRGDVQELRQQLERQKAGADIFADFALTGQAMEDLSGARVRFTGTPESWNEQDTGILSVRREGQEAVRAQCAWNGVTLEAELELPGADGYEYYFLLQRRDGTQEQKNITGGIPDRNLIDIAQGLRFSWEFDFEGGRGRKPEGEPWYLRVSSYSAYIKRPGLLTQIPELEAVEVILYKNGQETARTPLEITYDPGIWRGVEWSAETDTWSGSLEEIHYSAEARLNPALLLENLTSGDVVEAVLEIRVKDGPTWRETVEIWDPKELW